MLRARIEGGCSCFAGGPGRGGSPSRQAAPPRAQLGVEELPQRIAPAIINWTGAAAQPQDPFPDYRWSNVNNWSSLTVPGPLDELVFTGAGNSNTSSTVDAGFFNTIKALRIESGYTKRLTLANDLTVGVVGDTTTVSLLQSGGAVGTAEIFGAGDLTFQGSKVLWQGRKLRGIGSSSERTINANVTMEITGDQTLDACTLTNYGTVKWLDEKKITLVNGADIVNEASSSFVHVGGVWVGGEIDGSNEADTRFVIQAGATFTQEAAGYAHFLVTFVNSGSVVVQQPQGDLGGFLKAWKGGTSGGTYTLSAGAEFIFSASSGEKNYTFLGGSSSGDGHLVLVGGNGDGDVATVTTSGEFTARNFNHSVRSALTGGATFNVQNEYNWYAGTMKGNGTTAVLANAKLRFASDSDMTIEQRTIENAGTLEWTAARDIVLKGGAIITNQATFDIQSDKTIRKDDAAGGTLSNSGTVKKTAGAGTTTVDVSFDSMMGALTLNTGTLEFGADVTFGGTVVLAGGNLAGQKITFVGNLNLTAAAGQIRVVELVNQGIIGFGTNGVGILTIAKVEGIVDSGKFTQTASGRLDMNISNNTTSSKLDVKGKATLGGEIVVSLIAPYVPQGQQAIAWTLLTCESRVGQFATHTLPGGFTESYGLTSMNVTWNP